MVINFLFKYNMDYIVIDGPEEERVKKIMDLL